MAAPFDWIFTLSAVAFNLLIAGVFLATRAGKMGTVRRIGVWLIALVIPFGIVLYHTITAGGNLYVRVALAVVLAYLLTELLLDFILNYDFRAKWVTHVPYILVEYAAFYALIYVGFTVSEFTGWAVSVTFWIALAALIYYLAGRKKSGKKNKRKKG